MKHILITILTLLSLTVYAQEEFLEVIVEGREAFMSTKSGEVIFRKHAETDPTEFVVDDNGNTFYNSVKIHKVKKGETLSTIAKKHKMYVSKLKKDNGLKSNNLSIGQKLKIKKKQSVEILKPELKAAEGRVIASLPPGEVPGMSKRPDFMPSSPPPAPPTPASVVETKTEVEEVVEEDTPDMSLPNLTKSTMPKTMSDDVVVEESQPEVTQETEPEVNAEEKAENEAKEIIEIEEKVEETTEVVVADTTEEEQETQTEAQEGVALAKQILENKEKSQAVLKEKTEEVKALKETPVITEEKAEDAIDTEDEGVFHTVKKGETLYRISVNYKVSVDQLKKLNGLTSNNISIGQKLKVK